VLRNRRRCRGFECLFGLLQIGTQLCILFVLLQQRRTQFGLVGRVLLHLAAQVISGRHITQYGVASCRLSRRHRTMRRRQVDASASAGKGPPLMSADCRTWWGGVQDEPVRGPLAPHRTVAPRAPSAPLGTTHTTPKPASIKEGPGVVGAEAEQIRSTPALSACPPGEMHEHDCARPEPCDGTSRQHPATADRP
jgi:hypothetical protein